MKNMKFTFKTEKPTGRYKSFGTTFHHIKLKKIEVGNIDDNQPHKIRLMVHKDDIMEDGNPNCIWKWITLKKESKSVDEAKDFLNQHIDAILNKYKIYMRVE